MTASVLLLLAYHSNRQDRLELRSVGGRLNPAFHVDPSAQAKPYRTLFLNGHRTKLTMPNYYRLDIRARNKLGHVAGCLEFEVTQGDPMMWTTSYGISFTTARGTFERMPFTGEVIDDRGRVFAIPYDEQPMHSEESPHLMMWQQGRVYDLGPAYGWRLLKDGSVRGYYVTLDNGTAVDPANATMNSGGIDIKFKIREFTWKAGTRKESRTMEDKPPFPANAGAQWFRD